MKYKTLVSSIQAKLSDWGYPSDPDPIQQALNEYLWVIVMTWGARALAVLLAFVVAVLFWAATGEGLFQ